MKVELAPAKQVQRVSWRFSVLVLFCVLSVASVNGGAQQPQAGRNVNMVSGTQWPDGDPFLQRQNEPSLAISTRNAQHLLAGANDYRTVDLPSVLNSAENGDAWLGVFKSVDGGNTWNSTLLPGYPQDTSKDGLASPLKGLQAGSDPVIRAGAGGLFYYLGIAFNRTQDGNAVLFLSRFVDNNNKEAGDPIAFVDTNLIHKGNKKHFLDKPWLAVDVPRSNTKGCSIRVPKADGTFSTQTFPGGNVYASYTDADPDDQTATKLVVSRSTNCGVTWEGAVRLSDPHTSNSGSVIAIDPNTGTVYVAWRQIDSKTAKSPHDAIMIAKSVNGGISFSKPVTVAEIVPLDFRSLPDPSMPNWLHFRTLSYPTLAVDANPDSSRSGRVYVAWSEMGRGPAGESRIVASVSQNEGTSFSPAQVVDYAGGQLAYQTMPSMTFSGGKLMLVYYDFRWDQRPVPQEQTRDPLNPYANLWHTVDVRAAQADPANVPVFITAPVSRYLFMRDSNGKPRQVQANVVNYPLFAGGKLPFLGDYIDVAAPSMIQTTTGQWKFNTEPLRSPVFQSVWTDNRDVVPPPKPQDWTKYAPVGSPGATQSKFDPARIVDPCVAGTAGMRNQNIYTARITQGLVVSSPGNAKPLGKIQRAFVVHVENTTRQARYYRLVIIDVPAGTKASFLQFEARTSLDVAVAARSSIARPVFLTSTNPRASVKVNVTELTSAGGAPVLGGLQSAVVLNPDILNPDILNPDILNPEVVNPDILSLEVSTPNITNATLADFDGDGKPDTINPDILNPDILNPDILNPDILNPDILNPDILNPDILNPDILNPDILNPDILNPDILNSDPEVLNADRSRLQINDLFWKIKNNGNTTSVFTFKLKFPARPKGFKFQLLIYRVSSTPAVKGCTPVDQEHEQLVANIINPDILNPDILNPDILNSDVRNASLYLAPGDTARIQLRVFDLDKFDSSVIRIGSPKSAQANRILSAEAIDVDLGIFDDVEIGGQQLTASLVSNAVDTAAAQAGITQPAAATTRLTVTSTVLPAGQVGVPYSFQLVASGGTPPLSWTLASGSTLPPNLVLSSTGLLSGGLTTSGSFAFTVLVLDAAGQIAIQELTLAVAPPPGTGSLVFVTQPVPCSDSANPEPNCVRPGASISPPVSVRARNPQGAPIPNLAVTVAIGSGGGVLAGTATALTDSSGVAGFGDLTISQPGIYTLAATASGFSLAATSSAFNVLPHVKITTTSLPDGVKGRPYDITVASIGGVGARTWTVTAGNLPSGLVFDPSSGRIFGTPDVSGTSTFTVRVTDSGLPQQDDVKSFSIRIADPLLILTAGLPDGVKGKPYDTTIVAAGGIGVRTWTITSGNFPSDLVLNPASGRIQGTPNSSGLATFTVNVADSAFPSQNNAVVFSIRIGDPLTIMTSSLPDGVKGKPYDSSVAATGGIGSKHWTIVSEGSLPADLTLDPGTGRITGTPQSSVTSNFIVQVADSSSPLQSESHSFSIRIADPLVITTAGLPDGVKGVHYDYTVVATGGTGTKTWTVASGNLPSGLLLNPSDGRVSGTPVSAGTSNVTLQVADSASPPQQSETHSFSIRISDPLVIAPSPLPDGVTNKPYDSGVAATGGFGTRTWTIVFGGLPSGLTLDFVNGRITGSPNTAGTSNFTLAVTDSSSPQQNDTRAFSIRIGDALAIVTSTLPDGDLSTNYNQQLVTSGGIGTVTWTLEPPSTLPANLSLSPTGVISGTPTSTGDFNFTMRATDSSVPAQTQTRSFSLHVDIFIDEFNGSALKSAWQVQPGQGNYAFVDGNLRYFNQGPQSGPQTWVTRSLTLAAPFNGTDWQLDTRVKYNLVWLNGAGNSSGAQRPQVIVSFDPVSTFENWLDFDRGIDAYYGANYLSAFYGYFGTYVGGSDSFVNPADVPIVNNIADGTYYLRVVRHGASITMSYSYDGIHYGSALSTILLSDAANSYNQLLLSATTWETVGSFADFDYIRIKAIPPVSASQYSVPTAGGAPSVITNGPDGALWFIEPTANKIGRIATDGTITEFGIPTPASLPQGITAGPDGALWFTEGSANKIGRITTAAQITEYAIPVVTPANITTGPDGALWFTEVSASKIGRMTTAGIHTDYPTLTPNAIPDYITAGSDGALWFTEEGANKIGRITTAGVITEYPISGTCPDRITSGVDGALWFTEACSSNKIGKITTAGLVTEYPVAAFDITTGPDGGIWIARGGEVGRVNLAGAVTAEYSLSASGVSASYIVAGPDGAIWFTSNNSIGRFVVPSAEPLAIVTSTLPDGVKGLPYDFTVGATGGVGSRVWSITSGGLPSGLVLNSSNGRISGTPNSSGTSNITVKVADAVSPNQSSSQSLSIRVADPLVITTTVLPDAVKGKPYDYTVAATGGIGTKTWTVAPGNLPSGLVINSGNGEITGIPDSAGTSNFTLKVTDSAFLPQSAARSFAIRVAEPLIIVTSSLPDGDPANGYNQQLVFSGGIGAVTWSLNTGSVLPPNLSVSPDGKISGTPTSSGDFNFTIRATDSSLPAQSVLRDFALHIGGASASAWQSVLPVFGGSISKSTSNRNGDVYIITGGGLYKSTDNAQHWFSAAGDLPPVSMQSITTDAVNAVYLGTDSTIYKSTDGGQHWVNLGLPAGTNIVEIATAPSNANYVYAATSGKFVYRSTNAGATWSQSSSGLSGGWSGPSVITTVAVDPTNPLRAYTATWRGQIFRTDDGGDTWNVMGGGANYWIAQIAVSRSSGNVLFAVNDAVYTPFNNILKSTDSGSTWVNAGQPAGQQDYGYVAIHPTDPAVAYAATNSGLYKTTGGTAWTRIFAPPSGPMDIATVVISGSDPNYMYAGSSFSGLYVSPDRGVDWQQSNNGIAAARISDIAISPSNPSIAYAGAETVGLVKSTNGGATWSTVGTSQNFQNVSLGAVAISPSNSNQVLVSSTAIMKTIDGGNTFAPTTSFATGRIKFNPLNSSNVSASIGDWQGGFLFSGDGGTSWQVPQFIYTYPSNYTFHPTFSNIVFTVTNTYTGQSSDTVNVMWSNSGGNGGWTQGLEFGRGWVNDLVLDQSDPTTLYAVAGLVSENTKGVYKFHLTYSDNSVTSVTRVPGTFNVGLGTATPRRIVYGANHSIFLTTDNGVFRSADQGESWTSISSGLSYLSTEAMALSPDGSYLLVGTNGGIWKYAIPPSTLALYEDFSGPDINSLRWSPSITTTDNGFVRAIQNGELVLLTPDQPSLSS